MVMKFAWLLDLAPVGTEAYFGEDRGGELDDVFHLVLDDGLEFVGFGGEDVEEELVTDTVVGAYWRYERENKFPIHSLGKRMVWAVLVGGGVSMNWVGN
jgi:hypothetical protein